jgi:hypothetical protein
VAQRLLGRFGKSVPFYQEGRNSRQVNAMFNWIKDRVAERKLAIDEARSDFECNMARSFFNRYDIIQAIQNGNIRSGLGNQVQEEEFATITPWSFIQSMPDLGLPPARVFLRQACHQGKLVT